MTVVYWLLAYVVFTVIAGRFGTYAFMRSLMKRWKREGYTVTMRHALCGIHLHASKTGETKEEINLWYGWWR